MYKSFQLTGEEYLLLAATYEGLSKYSRHERRELERQLQSVNDWLGIGQKITLRYLFCQFIWMLIGRKIFEQIRVQRTFSNHDFQRESAKYVMSKITDWQHAETPENFEKIDNI